MAHETYIRESDSEKAFLFIHGFLGSPEHYEKFIEVIPDDYAVYNILLDGHGGSVKDFSNTSMIKWKEQVSQTIEKMSCKYKEIVICGHSMGTFFAIEESIKRPDLIKSVFLLAIPLKIFVRPSALINTMRSFFNLKNSKNALAYKKAHSVKLNKRIWQYLGWIPRYLELFKESKNSRTAIVKMSVPCYVFMSEKDELVSIKSNEYMKNLENVQINILHNSAHFIYSDDDYEFMINEFKRIYSL